MPNQIYADYFLGANAPGGFRSMFRQSYSTSDGWRVFIIKGGPGTGKSTLMRFIAQQAADAGHFVERIHCSSDPDSLDAVILPSLRRAIYDGTAPHVLEPALPGGCEQLLDLGQAWDAGLLYSHRDEIAELSRRCSACHRRATQMLDCAAVFRSRLYEPAAASADRQKISRAAERLCSRFGLTRRGSAGSAAHRLASAVTPQGITTAAGEYIASFGTVVPLLDRSFSVSGLLMSELTERLLDRGYKAVICPCSQDPDRIEHLLLPDEDICFTTRSDAHGRELHTDSDVRAVRSERFLPDGLTRGRHPEQVADRREMLRFTGLASECMRQAKTIHDQLEEYYKTAMDYSILDRLGTEAAERMLCS